MFIACFARLRALNTYMHTYIDMSAFLALLSMHIVLCEWALMHIKTVYKFDFMRRYSIQYIILIAFISQTSDDMLKLAITYFICTFQDSVNDSRHR